MCRSKQRILAALFFMLTVLPLYSQITVSGDSVSLGGSLEKSFLATRTSLGKEHSVLTILTRETSVQEHEGVEVYREVRDVEYTIKANNDDYTIKRKVLKMDKIPVICDKNLAGKYLDTTSDLQSTLLAPRKVVDKKMYGRIKPAPCKISKVNGKTSVLIDKMAAVRDEYTDKSGKSVLVKFMGKITELTEATETLCYTTMSDKLYIDDLKEVNTVFGSIYTKKGCEPLKMRNIEKIEIVTIKY